MRLVLPKELGMSAKSHLSVRNAKVVVHVILSKVGVHTGLPIDSLWALGSHQRLDHRCAYFSICGHYGPHVAYPNHRIGQHSSHHQRRGGEHSDNAADRDSAPDRGNDHNERPRVRAGSLAHVDNRDDKHCHPAANGQLADRDHLIGEGHLYI